MSLEESDDERSGLGSIEDGEDAFRYTEEGSESAVSPQMGGSAAEQGDVIKNQPHDEAMELDDESEDSSVASPTSAMHGGAGDSGAAPAGEQVENQPFDEAIDVSENESVESEETGTNKSPERDPGTDSAATPLNMETPTRTMADDSSEEDSESDSEDDDGGGVEEGQTVFNGVEGGYDPKEFENMEVSEDIRSIFGYIGRYNPHTIDLEPVLQPFLPDYVPAVGDIDAFIKLPRPDGKVDNLGITVLDEPALVSSEPAALEIQLRHASKKLNLGEAAVSTIENAEQNPKQIRAWVASIDEVHGKKPPPEVMYSKAMPDIESLMQVWPPQFEDELSRCRLPSKDLDVSLEDYVRIVCALFDIPVHNSLTESLHVLFTLYSEFKNNQHFNNQMDQAGAGGMYSPGVAGMDVSMTSPAGYGGGLDMDMGGGMGVPPGMGDTMGGLPGDPGLMVGGSMISPKAPLGMYDQEVAMMGDEINPPPVTYHQR